MTRHERRRLKKLERVGALEKEQKRMRFHAGHILGLMLVVAVVGAIVYGVRKGGGDTNNNAQDQSNETYTAGPVHWHAKIDLEVCGEKRDLPGKKDGSMVGGHLYHHHGDNTWHIEGRIIAKEDITLGRFFDQHEIPFDRDRLMEKKNGDLCSPANKVAAIPGKPGTVKMFVNGQPNEQFRDFVGQYTPNAQDTVIKVVFE